jgi:heme/copper-type cytochrome/quinol oxidase subunit 1
MIDAFDIIAFVVFGVLLVAIVVIVVGLGSLPGRIARSRGHPQAAAVNVASWLGLAAGGVLWPLALIWAFLKPSSAVAPAEAVNQEPQPMPAADPNSQLVQVQAQLDSLRARLRELQDGKEVHS